MVKIWYRPTYNDTVLIDNIRQCMQLKLVEEFEIVSNRLDADILIVVPSDVEKTLAVPLLKKKDVFSYRWITSIKVEFNKEN